MDISSYRQSALNILFSKSLKGGILHPVIKLIIGVILAVGSIYYIVSGIPGYLGPGLPDLLTVLNGAIPILVFVLGIFIVWLELDELKVEKEISREEKKPRRKK